MSPDSSWRRKARQAFALLSELILKKISPLN
jgi:hypothetical protein